MIYDANNPVYRFRGNIIETKQGSSHLTDLFDGSAWNRVMNRVNDEGVQTSYAYGATPGDVTVTTGSQVRTSKFNQLGILTEEMTSDGGVTFRRTALFDSAGRPSGMQLAGLSVPVLPAVRSVRSARSPLAASAPQRALLAMASSEECLRRTERKPRQRRQHRCHEFNGGLCRRQLIQPRFHILGDGPRSIGSS